MTRSLKKYVLKFGYNIKVLPMFESFSILEFALFYKNRLFNIRKLLCR